MTSPDGKQVADFVMASSEIERSKSYLERGRRYQALSEPELRERFVASYKAWAADVSNDELNAVTSDISAEYGLRGVEPPFELVSEEIEQVTSSVARLLAGLPSDRLLEINAAMENAFAQAQKKRN